MVSCKLYKNMCSECERDFCMGKIPLLSSLDEMMLHEISKGVHTIEYKKGEKIFSRGEKADRLYIVCSGKMKIYKNTIDGREQIIYILADGDFIGGFNLLKEDEFDFDAEALEDTSISTLEKSAFDSIILAHPEITLKVLEKAYERIRKAESLVERLSTNSSDAKVAGLLLNLMKDFGEKTDQGILLSLTINREEMGSYAGIARETVTRKLKLFEEMGLIKLIGTKRILIKSKSALRELM